MRKLLLLLTALVSAFTVTAIHAFADEYEQVKVDVPPNMLFLGDSIATGYGLDGYENGKENCSSYANLLAEKYKTELNGKCSAGMENMAIDGQTSSELLKGLQDGIYDSSLENADAIVLSIGGNDLLSVIWDFLANDLHISYNEEENMDQQNKFSISEIIKSITSLGTKIDKNLSVLDSNISQIAKYINDKSDGVLVIQTLYNPFDQFEAEQIRNFIADKIKALNSSIEAHKNDPTAEYIVADVYSDFYGRGYELTRIKSMDIHPNQEGHNVISQCVDKTIRTENYSYLIKKEAEQTAQTNGISQNNNKVYLIAAICAVFSVIIVVSLILKQKRKDI